jgi:Xaa-Pro aminopeptidase
MTAAILHHARTPDIGVGLLDDRERIDFAGLRRARQERVFEMMEETGLDACLFGREANVRYVSGARRLWLSQTRPFAPSCVVVRATRSVQLYSSSATLEGIPEALQPDDIFTVTWNPSNFVARISAAPGFTAARSVGVDGMTPMFAELFRSLCPKLELLPAEALMRRIRRPKLPAEVLCIRTAAAIAESAIQAAMREIAPGVSEKHLQAAYVGRMCELGTSTFSQQGTFTAIGPGGALRWITADRPLANHSPVAMAGGVLWAGYEGSLARTWWCGREAPDAQARRPYALWAQTTQRLVESCRPGATGAEVHEVFEADKPSGATFSVYSLGLGHEGKIAGSDLDRAIAGAQIIQRDMVLGVRVFVPGTVGGYLGEEMILVSSGGCERLTTLGAGPLAAT